MINQQISPILESEFDRRMTKDGI